jgi:hypothetical protein
MKKNYAIKKSWRFLMSALFLFFCCGLTANAQDCASDDPTDLGIVPDFVIGNADCSSIGSDADFSFKVDPPDPGTYALPGGGELTWEIVNGTCGQVVNWEVSAGVEIFAFIVKGGDDANVYYYDGTVTEDGNLHSPLCPSGDYCWGKPHKICYNYVPPATLSCRVDVTDVTCFGYDDGTATAVPLDFTGDLDDLTYEWRS